MPKALADHFGRLKRAIEAAGGSVVKETGDGVFAVFPAAPAALVGAVSAQQRLTRARRAGGEPLRARMGLHTGTAIRENGDYHGTEVHRCARVMAVAHGGQIVASEATYITAQPEALAEISFVDLGEHRLKDLARAERIRQVIHPELPADFPPLRSLGAFPNNLPAELSSFIGRDEELAAIQAALRDSRLVTLTGTGGSGKTRLALQASADRVEGHPDGVWLVDLAGLTDPRLVAQTVVSTMPIPERPGSPPLEVLGTSLADRQLLITLDNCEHVIGAAAELVDTVLRAAPRVRVLTTSREPLGVPGEVTWHVPPLSVGEDGWLHSQAVVLFVERARAADPHFRLTDENGPTVARICQRLDGLPLAIELAASRVRALSVDEIAERLHDRFALLTGGARTALPRQRTLEAAVAWSFDLLSEGERRLFVRLAVFAGTFDLSAVEAVCAGDGLEEERILDLLTTLVEKSLVSVLHTGGRSCYRLLETTRDYARRQLADTPDAELVRTAHTRWAVDFAKQAGGQLLGPEQARSIEEIRASMDDLRAAIARTIESGEPEAGLKIVLSLDVWWVIVDVREARYWLDQLLVNREALSPGLLGQALSIYGQVLAFSGEPTTAVGELETAIALLGEAGDVRGTAWATHHLGIAVWHLRDPDDVKRLTLQALTVFEQLNEPPGLVRCLWLLVLWELEFGKAAGADRYAERMLALANTHPVPIIAAHAAEASGVVARAKGDLNAARGQLSEAAGLHARIRNVACLSHCIEHIALWSLDTQEPARAARLLGAVDAVREDAVGASVPPFEGMWHDRASEQAKQAIGDEAFRAEWQRGRAMGVDEAIAAGLKAVE